MSKNDELKRLKIYTIKKLRKIVQMVQEQEQRKHWLTIAELTEEYSISRKTFDRMRQKGLEVCQRKANGKILVNRTVFENFLKLRK